MEHRWGRRQPMDVVVRFVALPDTTGTGRVLNMSATGAYMETTAQLRTLSILFLEPISMPTGPGRIRRMAASVVRRDSGGVGLEWCDAGVEKSAAYARLNAMSSSASAARIAAARIVADPRISRD